jgi:hypothetical protein
MEFLRDGLSVNHGEVCHQPLRKCTAFVRLERPSSVAEPLRRVDDGRVRCMV